MGDGSDAIEAAKPDLRVRSLSFSQMLPGPQLSDQSSCGVLLWTALFEVTEKLSRRQPQLLDYSGRS